MRKRAAAAMAAVITGAAALSACGSAAGVATVGLGSGSPVAPGSPIKLGVLTSMTGPAAPDFDTMELGFKARLGLQNAEGGVDGHRLQSVTADDTSSGPGAATAAQELIEKDGVFGIAESTPFFAGGYRVTTAAGVPVVGWDIDNGPEWSPKMAPNVFDAYGYGNDSVATTTWGMWFKSVGATKVGAVGYGNSPSAAMAATGAVDSARAVGLHGGFLDNTLPLGSTNVGPVVQQIKASGVNGLYLPIDENTAFAIVQGLQQAGVRLKSAVLATGYGQATLDSPATRQAAQGVDFQTTPLPTEVKTPATTAMVSALKKYAGVSGVPTFGEYAGWMTADLFIRGLRLAGSRISQHSFITRLRAGDWNSAGLESPISYSRIKPTGGSQDQDGCVNITQLEGTRFIPQNQGKPVCGKPVTGVTIASP